jgi:hypothetical protein
MGAKWRDTSRKPSKKEKKSLLRVAVGRYGLHRLRKKVE